MKQPGDAAQMEFATGEPGTASSSLHPHHEEAGPLCMSLYLNHPDLPQLAWPMVTQLGRWLAVIDCAPHVVLGCKGWGGWV